MLAKRAHIEQVAEVRPIGEVAADEEGDQKGQPAEPLQPDRVAEEDTERRWQEREADGVHNGQILAPYLKVAQNREEAGDDHRDEEPETRLVLEVLVELKRTAHAIYLPINLGILYTQTNDWSTYHPTLSSAACAADCSASCLLFPSPRAISPSVRNTPTVNCLSWSGPSSEIIR